MYASRIREVNNFRKEHSNFTEQQWLRYSNFVEDNFSSGKFHNFLANMMIRKFVRLFNEATGSDENLDFEYVGMYFGNEDFQISVPKEQAEKWEAISFNYGNDGKTKDDPFVFLATVIRDENGNNIIKNIIRYLMNVLDGYTASHFLFIDDKAFQELKEIFGQ